MSIKRVFKKFLLWSAGLMLSGGVLLLIGIYYYMSNHLPDIEQLKNVQLQVPLRIYSQDGLLIAQYGEKRRIPVEIENIPPLLIQAILSTEDQRFFEHSGVDIWGLLRAAKVLVIQGTRAQGGSTITMQVARNFFLTRKKTYTRKFNEILLAIKIDHQLSKKKILELYLNKIYLGNRAYGVAAAAALYYGKTLDELDLAQIAMIAGLPKAPSGLNPLVNPEAAIKRRNHVLKRMYELGHIDRSTYLKTREAPITAGYHDLPIALNAPFAAELAREIMVKHFGKKVYTQGYKVTTTIDSRLQIAGNDALHSHLLDYDRRHEYRGPEDHLGDSLPENLHTWTERLNAIRVINGLMPAVVVDTGPDLARVITQDGKEITLDATDTKWVKTNKANPQLKLGDVVRLRSTSKGLRLAQVPEANGALVALKPSDGAIRAMVGGFDYQTSKFNRVVQAKRQPGSLIKPFLYAAALANGETFSTVLNDAPVVIYNTSDNTYWRPQNHNRQFYGPTRLRDGMVNSINLISIRLLQKIGIEPAITYLRNFGFNDAMLPPTLSLALGTGLITPLDMASAFAVFANGGYRVSPYLIDEVTDTHDNQVFKANPKVACQTCITGEPKGAEAQSPIAPAAISPQIAYLIDDALHDVIQRGTGRRAKSLGRGDIGGKTGTTNDQIDNWFSGYTQELVATTWLGYDSPKSLKEYGSQSALPMWISFMQTALKGLPEKQMPMPPGLVRVLIDKKTGNAALPGNTNTTFELFLADNAPQLDTKAPKAYVRPRETPEARISTMPPPPSHPEDRLDSTIQDLF